MSIADAIRSPGRLWIALLLAVVTLAVYAPTLSHDFIDFDDPPYVTENPHVQAGLTAAGVRWAFTQGHSSNWHPLTWLSHMLDCELYGLQAGGHHATNLLFHTANTLLLFGLLARLTGRAGRSAVVAGLFALHPLHVESVAWIAERKDVLSTFFGLWTLWAYARYVERPGRARYLAALGLFALGLMSKPMLVTWPIVLLLLDVWPLNRAGVVPWRILLREKLPFLFLAVASCVVTFLVQREGGAVAPLDRIPAGLRLQTATLAYAAYLGKLVWPARLAIMYPLIRNLPVAQVAGAGLLLAALTFLALRAARRLPYLAVGWLFYLGTLVPVIGLVQVGTQRMADRYTYIPYIGLFIAAVWGLADWAERRRIPARVTGAAALAVLTLFAAVTVRHLPVWRDSIALYQQALVAGESGALVHFNLGNCLAHLGRMEEAATHYEASLRHKPGEPDPYCNLGLAFSALGRKDKAEAAFREAVRLQPDHPKAGMNLARLLDELGRLEEAERACRDVIHRLPDHGGARYLRADLLVRLGRPAEAVTAFREAFRPLPRPPDTLCRLGVAQAARGRSAEALAHFLEALRAEPDHLASLNAVAWIRATDPDPGLRDGAEAVRCAEKALRLAGGKPSPSLLDTLAATYAEAGRFEEAAKIAEEAGQILAERGDTAAAAEIAARRALYERREAYRTP